MKKILIPILLTIVAVTAVVFIGRDLGWFDRWLKPRTTTEAASETGSKTAQTETTAPANTSLEPDTMVVIDPFDEDESTGDVTTVPPGTSQDVPDTTESEPTGETSTEPPETTGEEQTTGADPTKATTTTARPTETEQSSEPESEKHSEQATSSDGKKYVALTFDDGPDMRYTSSTSRILDILEKYGAKATFFTLACQLDYNGVADESTGETFAERNAKLIKRAYDMGMEIGTHTYNHKNLNTLSSSEIREELRTACEKVEAITGAKITIMRPPYGNANATVREAIDMPMIIWDVDSLDWESKDADKIYSQVMRTVQPGSIILMHDIYNTTADGVAKVVPALIEKGYTIVTVSELYRIYGKELKPHQVYMAPWYDE